MPFKSLMNTAHADPDQEPLRKTRYAPDESEVQPDSSTAETDKGQGDGITDETNEDQSGPKEKKPGNEYLSGDTRES